MFIEIRLPQNQKVTVEADADEKVEDIMHRIEDRTGFSVEQMTLVHHGRHLTRDSTLFSNLLNHNSVLTLILQEPDQDGRNTVDFFVIVPVSNSQKTITMRRVSLNDLVISLKRLIADREGIHVDRQVLTFGAKPMRNELTLREMGVYDGCSIMLTFQVHGGVMTTR